MGFFFSIWSSIRMLNLNCSHTIITSWSVEKCVRKWSQQVCFPLTLWPSVKVKATESIKSFRSMVPISRAGVKEFDWKVRTLCPVLKSLPHMMGNWLFRQMNTADCIDPHVTHNDEIEPKELLWIYTSCVFWVQSATSFDKVVQSAFCVFKY